MKWIVPIVLTLAASAALAARRGSAQSTGTVFVPGSLLFGETTDASPGEQAAEVEPDVQPSLFEQMQSSITSALSLWRPPAQYAPLIAQTEDANGIPRDLLARLLYQESHYRDDIITGRTVSPAGALGIAQFMPATAAQLGIDPLDPSQAIPAAGAYLVSLYRGTGTWTQALAAYNWGIGNVTRKGLLAAPAETRSYYRQILADVNQANGTAIA